MQEQGRILSVAGKHRRWCGTPSAKNRGYFAGFSRSRRLTRRVRTIEPSAWRPSCPRWRTTSDRGRGSIPGQPFQGSGKGPAFHRRGCQQMTSRTHCRPNPERRSGHWAKAT